MNGVGQMNDFPMGKYGLILADPPWHFDTYSKKGQGKSASQHYDCMSLDEIRALPVANLADPAGCLLVLWTTGAHAAQGTHTDVMRAWGFEPSGFGAWGKVTRNALPAFGTGYVLRDSVEPFFTARRGRLPKGLKHSERNLILAEKREHSRKPDQMHQMLDRLVPDARKIELFARQQRSGWVSWGQETNKFTGPPMP
jgi:N6-adenosine-specific RNA methylase IME4